MKNKLISLLGLVSKKEYEALQAASEEYVNLSVDLELKVIRVNNKLDEKIKSLNWHVDNNLSLVKELSQTQRENANLKDEINALNNLRASDQHIIKKLGNRNNMVYYTCGRLKREFSNQRELAKHLNVSQFQVNYMLNGKIKNKYNIKRHER